MTRYSLHEISNPVIIADDLIIPPVINARY